MLLGRMFCPYYDEKENNTMTLSLLFTAILAIQSAGPAPSPHSVISVTLSSVSNDVKLGSEVRLKIVVTNTSNHEMLLERPVGIYQGEILNRFEVRDEKGSPAVKKPYYRLLTGEPMTSYPQEEYLRDMTGSMVKPGESVIEEVILNKLYELDKPGKYTIRVEHTDPVTQMPVKSNTITLTITP